MDTFQPTSETKPELETQNLSTSSPDPSLSSTIGRLKSFNARIEHITGLETRGIARVPDSERHPASHASNLQMALLWFSVNITANNLVLGMLGPLVYGLGFVDSAMCVVFGALLGSAATAWIGTFGPRSGCRTMIVSRWFMGYYPNKITTLLLMVIMVGYGLLDCIIGGQILSAVSGGHLSVVVGIIINAVITWTVCFFGMDLFHTYERYAWLPQLIVLFVLVGSAGPSFNSSAVSTGDATTIAGNRLSFFSLALSAPLTWAPAAADYFVYYPASTSSLLIFSLALSGLWLSFAFVYLLGVGLATGVSIKSSWAAAYDVSSGALLTAGFAPLGAFGNFCAVIVSLGVISNNIPGTYSTALAFQMLGRYPLQVPRWIWVCVTVLIYTACALGGRDSLFEIFENFLALMGYWTAIWIVIVLEEHYIFRRDMQNGGYEWRRWADREAHPIGLAAFASFLAGWAGAVVSMDQVYFVGPLARMVGEDGADMGLWLAMGVTAIVFPGLRAEELKLVGR